MKNKKLWPLLIVLSILLLIWIPVFYDRYNALTALFLMLGTVISGYVSERFLKKE